MSKYVSTLDVKAIQFTDEDSIKAITKVYPLHTYNKDLKVLVVHTHRGVLCMNKGDYIAEVLGNTVIIPADIFVKCFTEVEENEKY